MYVVTSTQKLEEFASEAFYGELDFNSKLKTELQVN